MTISISNSESQVLSAEIEDELSSYEQQIQLYLAGGVDETKMQKWRLHFGTYAQRQEGVQMQRIKIPAGFLTGDQLARLADAADQFGSGFIHFTTREDAQIYYVKLAEAPALLRFLAAAGITSREACGNTVRNITACYRAGTSVSEAFNVLPYAEALSRFLLRNKYNQNLGRKFKIAFEGCADDHSGLRIHDIGLLAVKEGLIQSLAGLPCVSRRRTGPDLIWRTLCAILCRSKSCSIWLRRPSGSLIATVSARPDESASEVPDRDNGLGHVPRGP